MNKILLFMLLVSTIILGACSKDDDNNITTNTNGKALVSKITCTYFDEEEEYSEWLFQYASNGQIEKIICTDNYKDDSNNRTERSKETIIFSRSENKLTVTYSDKEEDNTTVYTLNDKGYVSEYEHRDCGYCKCEYDANDYLIKGNNTGAIYTWANGNMVKERGYSNVDITYTSEENKANIDFTFLDNMNTDYVEYLSAFGYMGKQCKNLHKTCTDKGDTEAWRIDKYTFDKNGIVTKIEITEEGETACIYTIEYK